MSVRVVEALGVGVAAVHGRCAGADFERALAADIRIAAPGATFAADGVSDLEGCARRLARLVGEAGARDLLLTGRTVDATDARRLNLVTRVVAADALETEADALAAVIAARPPLAVAAVKDAIERTLALGPDDALALEQAHFCRLVATEDHRAAVEAFFTGQPVVFAGR